MPQNRVPAARLRCRRRAPVRRGWLGQDRLADPPDGVGDELDALIGVELPGRGHQPDVAFADEVGEREPAILVFLRHRDDEAQIALDQLLHGLFVARPHLPGDGDLLLGGEQRGLAHLEEVLVEDIAVGVVDAEALGGLAPRPPRLHRGRLRQNFFGRQIIGERPGRDVGGPLRGSFRRVPAVGLFLAHLLRIFLVPTAPSCLTVLRGAATFPCCHGAVRRAGQYITGA